MPLEIKKSERETTYSLIRRFQKKIQRSGILLQARKIRFRARRKSEQMKKREKVRKEELKKEYEKLAKLGKL
ncbi:MAG TPA: 30S ribosomal protein S21 [Candidatus Parcubacteria bacterium]|nr:30S ribosomal protein S21 [Candidatus Parcubacteria bacterium]